MTLEKAIRELIKRYEEAKEEDWVNDPVAWALYQTWKQADKDRVLAKRKKEKKENG